MAGWVGWALASVTWAASTGDAVRWTVFLIISTGLMLAIPIAASRRRYVLWVLGALGATFVLAILGAFAEIFLGVRFPASAFTPRIGAFAATSFFDMHPMNYFFLAAAFFAFHLLNAYLVDHININAAFLVSSAVSIALVTTYLRLVTGSRFAFREAALGQFVYLVLFSYAFFFRGFTGLAITVGAIATLFIAMQATGRIRWSERFTKETVARPAL